MRKSLIAVFAVGLIIMPLAIFGCKGKAPEGGEAAKTESTEPTVPTEEVIVTQSPVTEPVSAQVFSQETIPPTAAVPPRLQESGKAVFAGAAEHNKEIQKALKAAKFYTGDIDGKTGPRTKKAIVEFQKAKGLKPDGKVGPKTWAALEKYLTAR